MEATSGPSLWLILLTLGVLALGAAMAYGVLRKAAMNQNRKLVDIARSLVAAAALLEK